jgi:hypothetical protein
MGACHSANVSHSVHLCRTVLCLSAGWHLVKVSQRIVEHNTIMQCEVIWGGGEGLVTVTTGQSVGTWAPYQLYKGQSKGVAGLGYRTITGQSLGTCRYRTYYRSVVGGGYRTHYIKVSLRV